MPSGWYVIPRVGRVSQGEKEAWISGPRVARTSVRALRCTEPKALETSVRSRGMGAIGGIHVASTVRSASGELVGAGGRPEGWTPTVQKELGCQLSPHGGYGYRAEALTLCILPQRQQPTGIESIFEDVTSSAAEMQATKECWEDPKLRLGGDLLGSFGGPP